MRSRNNPRSPLQWKVLCNQDSWLRRQIKLPIDLHAAFQTQRHKWSMSYGFKKWADPARMFAASLACTVISQKKLSFLLARQRICSLLPPSSTQEEAKWQHSWAADSCAEGFKWQFGGVYGRYWGFNPPRCPLSGYWTTTQLPCSYTWLMNESREEG